MHRNTTILTILLLLIAALLAGVKMRVWTSPKPTPSPSPQSIVLPSPIPSPVAFLNTDCGIVFKYPADFKMEEASMSGRLSRGNEAIDFICGANLPKPLVSDDKIEEASVAGQKATLFHDTSTADGSPLDVYTFVHPQKKIDVTLIGYGDTFNSFIKELTIVL